MAIINPYDLRKKFFLNPQKVVDELEIETGKIVLDFGAGSGFWTLPLARKVGAKGMVIAVDRSEENLSIIRRKAEQFGFSNIKLLRAPYNSKIITVDEKVDYIIISNILTLIGKTKSLIAATKKVANIGTKLIIIDWKQGTMFGTDPGFNINEQEIIQSANESGYEFIKLLDAGSFHFALYLNYTGEIYEKRK